MHTGTHRVSEAPEAARTSRDALHACAAITVCVPQLIRTQIEAIVLAATRPHRSCRHTRVRMREYGCVRCGTSPLASGDGVSV